MDEITAPYAVAELAPPKEPTVAVELSLGAKTDLGRVRENNEDKFEWFWPDSPHLMATRGITLVVCDGMGGHASGQIASELACKTFLETLYKHPSDDLSIALSESALAAHRVVKRIGDSVPSRRGMGTTLTALSLCEGRAWVCQVGDSRCYRYRDGDLRQLSPEHTWVEEMVASGSMARVDAENHPYRHMLTRAIGGGNEDLAEVLSDEVREGDVYLLCSDGITNHVSDARLLEVMSGMGPSQAAQTLVTDALADGGSDNATVLIARVESLKSLA